MDSGIISDEDIQKVREASDIVSVIDERVPLKQRGRDFWCCCPFHNEKTPSCKVDSALQLFHCFGCGEGGDVFAFIMKAEDLTFPEAVEKLADRAHIELHYKKGKSVGASGSYKARLKAVCKETADFYHTQLMRGKGEDHNAARHYLSSRDLGGEVPRRWNLGFAPGRGELVRYLSGKGFKPKELLDANVAVERDGKLRDRFYNRIMFPINDVQGDCIAFGGRVVGKGEPKYLNSQETPVFHKSEVLYGLDHAKAALASSGTAIVVEGYTDVIALSESGVKNVVATLGTALTLRHIRILSRHAQKRIVYLFDGDEAGQRAADRALSFIDESMTPEAGRTKIELCAITLPDNLDPADFVEARGAQALLSLIEEAKPLLQYGIERRLARYDLRTAEGRSAALSDALSILAPIKDSLLAKDYAIQIAGKVRAREQDVIDQLKRLKPVRMREEGSSVSQPQKMGAYEVPSNNSQAVSAGQLPSSGAHFRKQLTQTELNRRKFEREFLSLCAQHPKVALQQAEALAQTQWHDGLHALLAQSILETLSRDPHASAAQIVSEANRAHPSAASVLTSGVRQSSADFASLGVFLAEELGISDAEDAIAALRQQLASSDTMSNEEYETLFESVVAMQKTLTARRAAHKPVL